MHTYMYIYIYTYKLIDIYTHTHIHTHTHTHTRESLHEGMEEPLCESVKAKLGLYLRPQDVGDTSTRHLLRTDTHRKWNQPKSKM